MANEQEFPSERKKRIREHLSRSSGGEIDFQRSPQNYNPNKTSPLNLANVKAVRNT